MSIPNLFNKIKREFDIDKMTIVYLCIIIGVGVSSFGLGRLSININSQDKEKNLPVLDNSNIALSDTKGDNNLAEKKYVASKNGKMYYSIGCSGAKRIKPENQIWFASASDAEKSGYSLSTTCK